MGGAACLGAGLLDRILTPGALSASFQPVFEVRARAERVHYLEALIRGRRARAWSGPTILFEYARRKNRGAGGRRLRHARCWPRRAACPRAPRVGVNVHASTLALDPEFLNVAGRGAACGWTVASRAWWWRSSSTRRPGTWPPSATASPACAPSAPASRSTTSASGHSNYLMVLECRPDYFKVDRHFVHGATPTSTARPCWPRWPSWRRPFGAQVVAEGVEEPRTWRPKGHGHRPDPGYLLGRPMPAAGVDGARRARRPREHGPLAHTARAHEGDAVDDETAEEKDDLESARSAARWRSRARGCAANACGPRRGTRRPLAAHHLPAPPHAQRRRCWIAIKDVLGKPARSLQEQVHVQPGSSHRPGSRSSHLQVDNEAGFPRLPPAVFPAITAGQLFIASPIQRRAQPPAPPSVPR